MTTETVNAEQVSNVSATISAPDASAAVVTLPPVATVYSADGSAILSKKEALALPANQGLSRRTVEKAILAAWADNRKLAAAAGREAINSCETSGGIIVLSATKNGTQTVKLIPAAKAKPESAKAKLARLESELAAAREALANAAAKNA